MRVSTNVAVVVPVLNKLTLTTRFLESFFKVSHPSWEMIVVDHGSTDGTRETLTEKFPWATVLSGDESMWWSEATNVGVRYALERSFDYVLTINNDTVVSPDFLSRLVETASSHPRSLVGSRIHFLDDPERVWLVGARSEWAEGVVYRSLGEGRAAAEVLAEGPKVRPVDALCGCGTLVPVVCYREIGLYDSTFCPHYAGDSEFVLRAARKGYHPLVDLRALIWNDASNTGSVKGIRDSLFSKRSRLYLPAMLKIHARYCPPRHLFRCFAGMYGPLLLPSPAVDLIRRLRGSPSRPPPSSSGDLRPGKV